MGSSVRSWEGGDHYDDYDHDSGHDNDHDHDYDNDHDIRVNITNNPPPTGNAACLW